MDKTIRSKPLIGISSCLLGNKVRHDGGHKRDLYITNTLGAYVEWVPVCPEFEVGMGIPRETVRLVGSPANPRMIAERSGRDWTRQMQDFARMRIKRLKEMGISGYILKKNSPSCGMEGVQVYSPSGRPNRQGRGLFARSLITKLPLLPVEEEGRLVAPHLRENFMERVFAYHRWQSIVAGHKSLGRLREFHSQEKLLILAHSEAHMRRLGLIVAQGKAKPLGAVIEEYGSLYMAALAHRTTARQHTKVLEHMLGYISKALTPDERQELLGVVRDYHRGLVPLVVPLTLIRHYAGKYDAADLWGQSYLQPHLKELMLRHHV